MQEHCSESSTLNDQVAPASRHQGSPIKDELGKRFGRLTVVQRIYQKRKLTQRCRAIWECRCDCGAEIKVSGNLLRKGVFKECATCAAVWEKVSERAKQGNHQTME
jgi:hypothetical protein